MTIWQYEVLEVDEEAGETAIHVAGEPDSQGECDLIELTIDDTFEDTAELEKEILAALIEDGDAEPGDTLEPMPSIEEGGTFEDDDECEHGFSTDETCDICDADEDTDVEDRARADW